MSTHSNHAGEISESSSVYTGHPSTGEGLATASNSKEKSTIASEASQSQEFSFVSSNPNLNADFESDEFLEKPPSVGGTTSSIKSRTHSYSQLTETPSPPDVKIVNNDNIERLVKPNELRSPSGGKMLEIGSADHPVTLRLPLSSHHKQEKRNSLISQYSGVVHDVDIDTIKYVVDKNSLNDSSVLSEVKTISSKSKSKSSTSGKSSSNKSKSGGEMQPIQQEDDFENYGDDSNSIKEAVKLPTIKPTSIDIAKTRAPIKSETTDINFAIPARSPRRPKSYLLPSESLDSYLKEEEIKAKRISMTDSDKSPSRAQRNSYEFRDLPAVPRQVTGDNESQRSASSTSKRVSVKIDDIMREFEDLKSELERSPYPKEGLTRPRSINSESNRTTTASASASFHTAESADSLYNEDELEAALHAENFSSSSSHEYNNARATVAIEQNLENEGDYEDIDPEIASTAHVDVQEQTSNTQSQKKNRKKKQKQKPKHKHNKVNKPFSYDTLAKLLNATDGIVIGQEFADIEIPQEEKYLIEQIVDSISRLTASMILNPTRYNQGCNRLQKVLDVLEGFSS